LNFKDFEKIIYEAIVLFSFLSNKAADIISYKHDFMKIIEPEDIEGEKNYFYREVYSDFVSSLFVQNIIIGYYDCNAHVLLKKKILFHLIKCDLKKLIFLLILLRITKTNILLTEKVYNCIDKIKDLFILENDKNL
jgi:hypothetical protein